MYQKLKPADSSSFHEYISSKLLSRSELPAMSVKLNKKITESIYEMFVNAQIHSATDFIYCCGQFFPKKNVIAFTIADAGIGMKARINNTFNSSLSGTQAMKWAYCTRQYNQRGYGGIRLSFIEGIYRNQ